MTQASGWVVGCPLCDGEEFVQVYDFSRGEWLPGTVVRCRTCGFRYKRPAQGVEAIRDLYRRPDFSTHEYWENEQLAIPAFEEMLARLVAIRGDRRGRLLDIGCGPGTFAQLAQLSGFEPLGVDLNPDLADRARSSGIETIVGEATSHELDDQLFEVITLIDVIEHVLDPRDLLRRAHDLMAPGGHLLVYTPNHQGAIVRVACAAHRWSFGTVDGPVTEIFDGPHVSFFDPSSLQSALESAGLRVVEQTDFPYESERSGQAAALSARALSLIERCSRPFGGQFRTLVVAESATSSST